MILASSKQLLLITFAIALCRHLRASHSPTPPPPSEECTESVWPCPACFVGDTPAEFLNYTLKISNMEYISENEEGITVRVHSKFCPSLNETDFHSLPNWFRLEAISEVTSATVGKFVRPSSRSESHLCSEDTTIIFSTSETDPLDFPKIFTWKVPTEDVPESICFRLTLHSNRHWCQQTKTCISLRPESTSGMSGSASASGDEEYPQRREEPKNLNSICSQSRVDRCYKNWNCTGSRMVRFCGSNGMMFNSRCERRLWQCLTNKSISISSRNFAACMPSCNSNSAAENLTTCQYAQQYECGGEWEPRCTRKGLFKLVQCARPTRDEDKAECWCVHPNYPAEIRGTRRSLNCTDSAVESFDFATFCSAV